MRHREVIDALCEVNFLGILKKNGEEVDRRVVHNVLTDVGGDWLAHLIALHYIGSPNDIPVTQRRVRWIAVGTGITQEELPTVEQLEVPVPVDDAGNYLVALEAPATFPPGDVPTCRVIRRFGVDEITLVTNPTVPISEAGLFVDIYQVQNVGGESDSPWGEGTPDELKTTLNPKLSNNTPICYARFEPLTKTRDFTFEIQWDFRF